MANTVRSGFSSRNYCSTLERRIAAIRRAFDQALPWLDPNNDGAVAPVTLYVLTAGETAVKRERCATQTTRIWTVDGNWEAWRAFGLAVLQLLTVVSWRGCLGLVLMCMGVRPAGFWHCRVACDFFYKYVPRAVMQAQSNHDR